MQTASTPHEPLPGLGNDLDLVWGAAEIAKVIGLSQRQAFHLLERQMLPAKKLGGRWVASRDALRRHLVGQEG